MDVNLRGLNGVMTEILLHDTEIMRAFVEFTCVTVPNFMRRNARRGIEIEDMLHRPGRDGMAPITEKDRAFGPAVEMFPYHVQRIRITKNDPDFSAFSPDTDGLFIKTDVFGTEVTKLRDTHAGRVNRSDEQGVAGIFQRCNESHYLLVPEILEFAIFNLRSFDAVHRVCIDNILGD